MSSIGSATLTIVPKFDGLSNQVNAALNSSSATAAKSGESLGKKVSSGVGSGLATSGAVIGAFSTITSKALDVISSHVGSAASRLDTLNNYPRVMQSLGYSAEDAQTSISTMSDRLSALPTKLDDMVSVVQGIAVCTGDLDQATNAGLALNDMLVASGSSTQVTTAAMEQFRQMLSKGKPDMQDWKSLVSAMPGQMDQLAKSMLGPTATANDLYTALGGGGAEATVSMDDLLNAMIRLDTEGGDSFASFQSQAETACGGIETSVSNLSNAVTKGLANTFDTIGSDTISGVLNDLKSGVNDAFKVFNSAVKTAVPLIKSLWSGLKDIAPMAITATAAFVGFSKGLDIVQGVKSGISALSSLGEAIELAAGGAGTFAESFEAVGLSISPVTIGIGAAAAAIGVIAVAYNDWKTKTENLTNATTGLNDVVSRTGDLSGYKATIEGVGTASDFSAKSVDDLAQSISDSVTTMQENTAEAENTIATLNTAEAIVDSCIGKTDLSTEAQGKLKWALSELNDQLGTNITEQDVLNGKYEDADGNVQDLKQSLDELVASKKEQARVDAITANLTEAYSDQSEAAKTLANEQNKYNKTLENYLANVPGATEETAENNLEVKKAKEALQSAQEQYDATTDAVNEYSEQLGDAAAATQATDDAMQAWANGTSVLFQQQLASHGQSLSALTEDLSALGASTEDLGKLTDEQLETLARDYDGTTSSIVGDLVGWGVNMDDAAVKAAEMAQDIEAVLGRMDGLGDTLSGLNVNVADFSQALADAGVSTETLNSIGSENLQALAEACDGNVSEMVACIELYNAEPIVDKDGTVNVDDVKLVDAQGNLYTWNGSELLDKDGNAAVADTSVTDAQGHKLTWNGTDLQYKSADGTVHNLMDNAIDARNDWNRTGLNNYTASGTINIFKNITETVSRIFGSGNAKGGIRPHADGGIRYHANGAIATKAMPLDIVGEAGAEAIVPLTNKRYSLPFAKTIAEQMGAHATGTAYNVYIDSDALATDAKISAAIDGLVSAVQRRANMR